MNTTDFERDVLAFDPFDGDFGEPGDSVLRDKMVNARKPGPCSHCGCKIIKGERVRSMSARFGDLMSYRWCSLCCAAMAKCQTEEDSDDSDGEPAWHDYEARAGLAAKLAAQAAAKEGGAA